MRNTVKTIHKLFTSNQKIVCLTAYDFQTARIIDGSTDLILVGDSLAMVVYGMDSTLPVSLETMVNHTKAVVKGAQKAFVVIDMPFGTYQLSKEMAFKNCAKAVTRSGAGAVKIEGGVEMAETIKFLTDRGIAVMGHIGLKPQHFNKEGGFVVKGREKNSYKNLLADVKELEEAGCFAIVLESVTKEVADKLVKKASVPIIGIGASESCHGQILVTEDLIGLTETPPKFVKEYGDIATDIQEMCASYSEEVRNGKFPSSKNTYS